MPFKAGFLVFHGTDQSLLSLKYLHYYYYYYYWTYTPTFLPQIRAPKVAYNKVKEHRIII